jgi:hypothetical protein
MADKKYVQKLGDIKISVGNQNTIGHVGHVVNQAPRPELRVLSHQRGEADGLFFIEAIVEVVSPYPPGNLYLEAKAENIVELRVTPARGSMLFGGRAGLSGGVAFTNVQSPFGQYVVYVTARSQDIKFDYRFE